MFTDVQLREVFHFCFLKRLLALSDPALYILKGGVNLRFFFNSPRYSEDMDLDAVGGNVATLKKNGYKILGDAAFIRSLRTFGITDLDVNDPAKAKHTETTQRFRLGLINSSGLRLPTKVEFSRRENQPDNLTVELINPDIAKQYNTLSYSCRHYPGVIAALQKIDALAGRPSTQARDVFDLYLLHLNGFAREISSHPSLSGEVREKAVEAVLGLTYENFQGQVLEFIDAENRTEFGSVSSWENIQETVLGLINNA